MIKKIGYVVDSTASYFKEDLEKENVSIAYLGVTLNGEPKNDVTNKEIVEAMGNGIKVKTSQPSPGSFLACYKEQLKKGNDYVIVLTMTLVLSGTYNSALTARSMIENEEDRKRIIIIDTQTTDCGVYYAYKKAKQLQETASTFKELVDKIKIEAGKGTFLFMVDSLKALKENGRIGTVAYFATKLLKIKPIIKYENDKLSIVKKAIGGYTKAKKAVVEQVKAYASLHQGKKVRAFVGSVDDMEKSLEISEILKKEIPGIEILDNVYVTQIIATHLGKGCIGIYMSYE